MKRAAATITATALVLAIVAISGQGITQASRSAPQPLQIRVDGIVIGTMGNQAIEYDLPAREVRIYTAQGVVCQNEPRFTDRFERAMPDVERRPRR